MALILNMIRGFCMALADSVPGVSGGTIAFVLGFYDQFIDSLNSLVSGTKEERKVALIFLGKLGCGWVIGFVSSVLVLNKLFLSNIYDLSSLFIGLSIFSLPIIINEEKKVLQEKYSNVIFTFLGIALVVLITYFNPANSGTETEININSLSLGLGLYIFVAAAIAISAMVLPGISGSTLLLIFGLYVPIITAIKEFLKMDFSYFNVLCVFGLGIATGILCVIRTVKNALHKHRSRAIYLILGLMIGSIYAIVLGPTTLKVPKPAMDFSTFSIIFFLLGGVFLGGLTSLKNFFEKNN